MHQTDQENEIKTLLNTVLEKLTVAQGVKKCPKFYRAQRFTASLTKALINVSIEKRLYNT
jgi:hypothetical protein